MVKPDAIPSPLCTDLHQKCTPKIASKQDWGNLHCLCFRKSFTVCTIILKAGNTFGLSFIVFHPRRLRLLQHSLFPPILPSAVLVIAATKATNHWGSDKSCHRLWPSLSPLPGKDRESERVTQGSEPGKRKQPEEERKKYERTLRKNSTM